MPYSDRMDQDQDQESSRSKVKRNYPAIQGLRGFAILLVLLCHLKIPYFGNGFIGVDIFFAISGFLITRNMVDEYLSNRKASKRQGWISFLGFYSRRARRIFPAAYAVLILILLFWKIVPSASNNFATVLNDATWTTFFLANLHFMNQATAYFGEASTQSPFLHFWSLAVEEQFYLFWPILFLASTSTRGFKIGSMVFNWRKRVQVATIFLVVPSFILYSYQTWQNLPSSYFSTIGRFWEFGLGSFFALLAPRSLVRARLLFFYACLSLALLFFLVLTIDHYRYLAVIPVVLTAVLMNSITAEGNIQKRWAILESRLLLFLGKISFSLYLVHWPLIVFFESYGKEVSGVNLLWFVPLLMLSSFLLHREVETRFMKLKIPTVSKRSAARRTRYFPLNADALRYSSILVFSLIFALNFQQGLKRPYILDYFQPKTVEPWNPPAVETNPSPPSTDVEQPSFEAVTPTLSLQAAWEAKIRSALSAQVLTAGIQPSVDELDSERLGIWDKCLTIALNEEMCNQGIVSAKRKVFILGDSYALSSTPMIAGALSGSDYYILARNRAQCMVPRVETLNFGKIDLECAKHRDRVNKEIEREKPYLVVAMSLNSNFISGSRADLIEGMKQEYSFLVQHAQHVIVIGETPFVVDPRKCMNSSTNLSRCVGGAESRADYRALTSKYAEESGATFLDITQWMCLNSRCPVVIDKAFVTWDGGHLSKNFSKKLSPLFRSELQRLGIY